jgi:HAD superfamily hydrolase (TIGR01459 family)
MTQIISALDDIIADYDALYCDIWGVIHNGRGVYAAACSALVRARRAGKIVVLITNAPKPRGPLPGQLARLGAPRDMYDAIVTSGDATRAELAARAPGPMYKIGPAEDYDLWEGLGLQQSELGAAAFIAASGLNNDNVETPADYADTLQAARERDLDLICANPDIVVQVGDRLVWCAGALARDYKRLGGHVIMAGKPFAAIYREAGRECTLAAGRAIPPERILAIGDGIGTDVRGADAQGLDCLFIASGLHGEKLETGGALDTTKVKAALAAENAHARYVMAALAYKPFKAQLRSCRRARRPYIAPAL